MGLFGRKDDIDFDPYLDNYHEDSGARGGRWLRIWCVIMLVLLLMVAISVHITDINVIGNETYTEEEAVDLVFEHSYEYNSIFCFLQNRFMDHKELPFIEDYDIRFQSPFAIDLIIYEKSIVGCLSFMSSYMYFDREGIIVENSTERLPGVPEITGLSFGHIVLNQRLPIADEDIFAEIMNITQQLDTYGIESEEISFDASGNVMIHISGTKIDVELGKNESIDAKILALSDMLPSLVERELDGRLDLSNYSELNDNNDVSFKLNKQEDTEEPLDTEVSETEAAEKM